MCKKKASCGGGNAAESVTSPDGKERQDMKYYHEHYNDKDEFVREEITKSQAIIELGYHYNNPEQCAEMPCYYRTMFGGVDVVEE